MDTHFDLSAAQRPDSSTSFYAIAQAEQKRSRPFTYQPFNYTVIGISEPENSYAMFERTQELGVNYILDEDCTETSLPQLLGFIDSVISPVEAVYLSIDLGVLPPSIAPGVSTPATLGISPGVVLEVAKHIADVGKLCLLDVVELNPRFDIEGRTARLAARIIHEVTKREAD